MKKISFIIILFVFFETAIAQKFYEREGVSIGELSYKQSNYSSYVASGEKLVIGIDKNQYEDLGFLIDKGKLSLIKRSGNKVLKVLCDSVLNLPITQIKIVYGSGQYPFIEARIDDYKVPRSFFDMQGNLIFGADKRFTGIWQFKDSYGPKYFMGYVANKKGEYLLNTKGDIFLGVKDWGNDFKIVESAGLAIYRDFETLNMGIFDMKSFQIVVPPYFNKINITQNNEVFIDEQKYDLTKDVFTVNNNKVFINAKESTVENKETLRYEDKVYESVIDFFRKKEYSNARRQMEILMYSKYQKEFISSIRALNSLIEIEIYKKDNDVIIETTLRLLKENKEEQSLTPEIEPFLLAAKNIALENKIEQAILNYETNKSYDDETCKILETALEKGLDPKTSSKRADALKVIVKILEKKYAKVNCIAYAAEIAERINELKKYNNGMYGNVELYKTASAKYSKIVSDYKQKNKDNFYVEKRFDEIKDFIQLNEHYDYIDKVSGDSIWIVRKDFKYGFINSQGKEILPLKYQIANRFYKGIATVKVDGIWIGINKQGKTIFETNYSKITNYKEGLACIEENKLKGFIDTKGKIIIAPKFKEGYWDYEFNEGYCWVKDSSDNYGVIDKFGKKVIDFKYQYESKFKDGIAFGIFEAQNKTVTYSKIIKTGQSFIEEPLEVEQLIDLEETIVKKINGKYGFYYRKGNELLKPTYTTITNFVNKATGIMGVELNGKFGYVDKYGTLITDFIYSGLSIFENGIGVVEVDGKEGAINEVGKMIIPPLQKYVQNLGEGLVLFIGSYNMEGKMWNTSGQKVGDLYGGYFPFNNGISMFDRNKERLSINTKGKIVAKGWFESDGTPKQAPNKGNISSSKEITNNNSNTAKAEEPPQVKLILEVDKAARKEVEWYNKKLSYLVDCYKYNYKKPGDCLGQNQNHRQSLNLLLDYAKEKIQYAEQMTEKERIAAFGKDLLPFFKEQLADLQKHSSELTEVLKRPSAIDIALAELQARFGK